jgi:hypothetical protein
VARAVLMVDNFMVVAAKEQVVHAMVCVKLVEELVRVVASKPSTAERKTKDAASVSISQFLYQK